MRQPIPATWIVVMDSSRAAFYRLHHAPDGTHRIDEAAPMLTPGGHHHGAEPHHDPHKLDKHDFVHAVVLRLKEAFEAHEFARLAVVAPHRTLGEFRSAAPEGLRRVLWREIGKDLVKLNREELWDHIGAELIDHPGETAA